MMRSWIEISKSSLLLNVAEFRTRLAPGASLLTVVKANAYGHGLEAVAPVVAPSTDWFGVDSLEEALSLDKLGLSQPTLILGYTPADRADEIVSHGFRQVVYDAELASALSRAAQDAALPARIHLKIETGTHRQGVSLTDLPDLVATLNDLPGLEIEGAYTHFANIEDTLDPSFAELQLKRFREGLDILERSGVRPPLTHTAATAGVLLYPETHFNLVRVGMGAYGIWPSRETQIATRERGCLIALTPVLTWKTRIAQVKHIAAGDYVGYGLTFQAPRAMRIAVVPTGYFDGYDRKLANGGRALVGGRAVSVVGRIAMNMMVLDVTECEALPDAEVVLLGRQGTAEIRAEELADKVGTIPYEILARLNPLLPRIVVA